MAVCGVVVLAKSASYGSIIDNGSDKPAGHV